VAKLSRRQSHHCLHRRSLTAAREPAEWNA